MHYGKVTIILFGSRARGDYSASSDTDLLIILERSTWDDLKLILDLAYKCGVASPEPHVFSIDFVVRNFENNTLLLDAVYEGKVLVDEFNIIETLRKRLEIVLKKLKKTRKGWLKRDEAPS